MNDTDNTQDRGLTTEQIAAAGTWTGQEDVPRAGRSPKASMTTTPAASPRVLRHPGTRQQRRHGVAAGPGARASLLEDGELQSITRRWKDIQADFVDEPEQSGSGS